MEEKICRMIEDVLELATGVISIHTKMSDVDEWDSFGQLAILSELEKMFQIKLTRDEMFEVDSVESILKILQNRGL